MPSISKTRTEKNKSQCFKNKIISFILVTIGPGDDNSSIVFQLPTISSGTSKHSVKTIKQLKLKTQFINMRIV